MTYFLLGYVRDTGAVIPLQAYDNRSIFVSDLARETIPGSFESKFLPGHNIEAYIIHSERRTPWIADLVKWNCR